MSQSEVFRPADGNLFIRDNIANGVPVSPDAFRKRPASQGGYRFGQLSHNSFFTRHNPHPHRVRHLKGLLDVPICSVNDDGYFASPRYSLQFPPNSFNNEKLANNVRGRIPINALNVNSQLHPINTITGLQYFTGLNSYPFREKAIPNVGLVPVTEAWRDELKAFTEQISKCREPRAEPEVAEERPRTTQYSTETGRLIPPPSRAMSRGASRRGRQNLQYNMQHISANPDTDNAVLTMLCQILQTDDVNAVQSWLVSAGEREKSIVMDMIKSAIESREEYYKQRPAEVFAEQARSVLPPINDKQVIGENEDMIDRLTLKDEPVMPKDPPMWRQVETREPVEHMPGLPVVPPPEGHPAAPATPLERPQIPMRTNTPKPMIEDSGIPIKPPTNEVFKPNTSRPGTQGGRTMDVRPPASPDARLKYTKSPLMTGLNADNMWNQQQSVSADAI